MPTATRSSAVRTNLASPESGPLALRAGRARTKPVDRLFTPGPVTMSPALLEIAVRQLPYNRTADFSDLTRELLVGLAGLFDTRGEVAILTASGTGAMEAAATNLFDARDRLLVVNGGVFGQRWVELCILHGLPFDEIPVPCGRPLDVTALDDALRSGRYSGVLATAHETSTGVLHDMESVGRVTHRHSAFLVVDAISTIGADLFHMDAWHIDAAILSSQKALALPPGLAFVALGSRAKVRLTTIRPRTMYFRLEEYLRNQERGQAPFTPAIGLYLMLQARLQQVQVQGLESLVAEHAARASYFRSRLSHLPVELLAERPSNALSALRVAPPIDARQVVTALAARYRMFVTPNGGELNSQVLRVGHLGEQSTADLDALLGALEEVIRF